MQAALEIGMSGHTIGKKTLCSEIYQLQAGQLLLFDNKETIVSQYYFYKPWKIVNSTKLELKKINHITYKSYEKLSKSCEGKQIAIPLSGGYDSRLIASGLHKIGFKMLFAFHMVLKKF